MKTAILILSALAVLPLAGCLSTNTIKADLEALPGNSFARIAITHNDAFGSGGFIATDGQKNPDGTIHLGDVTWFESYPCVQFKTEVQGLVIVPAK